MGTKETSAATASKPKAGVQYNEPADAYELGATIDGHFVPFYTLDGPTVRARVASETAKAEASSGDDNGSS